MSDFHRDTEILTMAYECWILSKFGIVQGIIVIHPKMYMEKMLTITWCPYTIPAYGRRPVRRRAPPKRYDRFWDDEAPLAGWRATFTNNRDHHRPLVMGRRVVGGDGKETVEKC